MGKNDEEDEFEDANVYENITWKSIFKRRMSGCGPGFWFSRTAVKHYCQQAHKSKSCIRDNFYYTRKNSI